jgi:hypothetical protein
MTPFNNQLVIAFLVAKTCNFTISNTLVLMLIFYMKATHTWAWGIFLEMCKKCPRTRLAGWLVATSEIDECIGMQIFAQLIQHHLKSLLSNIGISPTIKWFHQYIQIYVHLYKFDYF